MSDTLQLIIVAVVVIAAAIGLIINISAGRGNDRGHDDSCAGCRLSDVCKSRGVTPHSSASKPCDKS